MKKYKCSISAERIAYVIVIISLVLFIFGITSFEKSNEWEYDRISSFMQSSMICYIVVSSFCFVSAMLAASHKSYHAAVTFTLLPTTVSLCFFLFGKVTENNVTSWGLMFLSSLGIYPILYIDKKLGYKSSSK